MFDSLLIANRGEIACRIMRTARKMGLRTIAVYSDADAAALHVQMADHAVHIGPAPAAESYLRTDRILDAARVTGAEAIHPGYGFLSEQADLVQGCAELGITWVGPHIDAIRAMGSKIEAKKIALEAGIPCIPGYSGEDQSDNALAAAAHEIGLPVMVKASAGGGGKGMRAVFEPIDLEAAIRAARTEATRSFGDGRLLIERLIVNPRHIEVQLLGDKHGTMLHLFERDCSVQRNHQKILEEAPAPNLRQETRAALYSAAVGIGRKIGYDSTGTVEFIMDAETEGFYFLEMNTRLQVEHTVTEEVCGVDLVDYQLRAAAGEKLSLTQDQITCTGHAIEARLTAEDASKGFLPDTGKILHFSVASELRTDSGIQAGSVVGTHYDSLIAKLISHGRDRNTARQILAKGLERLEVAGVTTTRTFLRDALLRQRFAEGRASTSFLPQEWPEGWQPAPVDSLALAALAWHIRPKPQTSLWQSVGGFRLLQKAGHPAQTTYLDPKDPGHRLRIADTSEGYEITGNGSIKTMQAEWNEAHRLTITHDGIKQTIGALIEENTIHLWGQDFDAAHQIVCLGDYDTADQDNHSDALDQITAPMPGLVVELRTELGADVAEGDTLAVMESMKLLLELKARAAGKVKGIQTETGNTVEAGALLVQLKLTNAES